MNITNVYKLVFSILICQLAAVAGSLFTRPSIPTWYATLQKPGFNPPNWLFAPVWTILFTLMGISAYLVWSKGFAKREVRIALSIFGVQLVLNVLWSFFFFKLRSPFYALIEIVILWATILVTVVYFFTVSRAASLLLFPYIAWVSFAVILNFYLFKLNL